MHHVVYVSLLLLPAEAQSWFGSLDRNTTQWFGKYASGYLSPSLILFEASALASLHDESIRVRTLQNGRHIVVLYTKDELEVELVVRLPETFPLKTVEVSCEKKHGVAESLWRKWMLQMKIVLSGN